MDILKLGSSGKSVKRLKEALAKYGFKVTAGDEFDKFTESSVKSFQIIHFLKNDGIVGFKTWERLLFNNMTSSIKGLRDEDYENASYLLSCEKAIIQAVAEVEVGNLSGFIEVEKPTILFEGHVFWNHLELEGVNPYVFIKGNEDIIYKTWSRKYYKGGLGEYERFNRAFEINEEAAIKSTSWGMFQILGSNYKSCGCDSVFEFKKLMSTNSTQQLRLFIRFIRHNNMAKYLVNKQWSEFARRYNGPSFKVNEYDTKLARAYIKYQD